MENGGLEFKGFFICAFELEASSANLLYITGRQKHRGKQIAPSTSQALVIAVFLLSDQQLLSAQHIWRAIGDSAGHATLAGLVWLSTLVSPLSYLEGVR